MLDLDMAQDQVPDLVMVRGQDPVVSASELQLAQVSIKVQDQEETVISILKLKWLRLKNILLFRGTIQS